MKARVNKKWWQFWLPDSIDIEISKPVIKVVDDPIVNLGHIPVTLNPSESATFALNNTTSSAIEADEAEPWYGGDAVEDEDSSVVTAEPPIVYANRGNARMEERRQARERQG